MWKLSDFGLDGESFESILEKSKMKIENEEDLGSPELESEFGHIELAVSVTTPHTLRFPFADLEIKNLPVPPLSSRTIIREPGGKIVGDDLSLRLSHIVMINRTLQKMIHWDKENPDRKTPTIIIEDMADHLDYLVRTYLDRDSSYQKDKEDYLVYFLDQIKLRGKSLDSILDRLDP